MDKKYEYIINASKDFITLIDRDYVYTVVNDSYCRAIGKEKEEVLNRAVPEVWGEELFEEKLKGYIDRCFAGEEVHYIEKFKFGVYQRYMHVSYYPYFDGDGETVSNVCVFSHDITKLGEIESKLINYEYRDPVTGLFNRKSLEIILDMELEKARRSEKERLRGILYIGIENLTDISRTHGHNIGNILLENAGLKVKEMVRRSDYVFRFEGNEFVVILSRLAKDTDSAKVAEKILDALSAPYNYMDFTISLETYVGIALFPRDGKERDVLLENAIHALEEAKREDKGYLLFDADLHKLAVEKLSLERDLYRAFNTGQFELYYQPIVDENRTIRGAEALIRWHHPRLGLIAPAGFIPLAEETGVVSEIGKWAIFTATKQVKKWLEGYDLYVSINISAPEFENGILREVISAALRQAEDLDPSKLVLELTESEGILSPERTLTRMNEIINLGVQIYIDDFGTGLSSLQYLKILPTQALKIDKAFVDAIEENPAELEFLERIIALVKARGKRVVVEGVATEGQYHLLRRIGCDRMQGYYFSHPVTAEYFTTLLEAGGRLPII